MKARGAKRGGRSPSGDAASLLKRLRQAERRLRQVEERYELVMGAVGEGVYDWNIAKGTLYLSAGVHSHLGLPPAALKTTNDWLERIHPDDLTSFRAAHVAHFKGLTPRFECDYRFRGADGNWRWARTHGVALRNRSGRAVRMIGSTGDITELKERERELAAQKAILETTFENIDQGITMVDKDLHTIALNRRFLDLLGFPPEGFARGFHMAEAFRFNAERGEYGPGPVEEHVRQRLELARRFEPHAFERARPDGTVIAVRGKPLSGGGFVSTYTDVTEQRRAEEALKNSEQRYELATSVATAGIYEWDLERNALFLTERARAFFSFPTEALTPADWNRRIHPDDYEGYRSAIVEHFKGRTSHLEYEYRIAAGQGGYRWALDRGIGVRNAEGRVTKVIGGITDITRRKQAEIELRRARDQAEEALAERTATAETLRVVAQLQTDVQPVFDAIVRNAVRLCGAQFGGVFRFDGELLHLVATHNFSPRAMEVVGAMYPMRPDRSQLSGRAVLTGAVQRLEDLAEDADYATDVATAVGWRRLLAVPMLREAKALGVIAVSWRDPGPIPERQVELLKTFADQAVIAIESVRLLTETKEALEQQGASAVVLQAISSSIADTAPVFDKILESCQRLFAGRIVGLNLVREDGMLHIGAYHGAHREEFERIFPIPATSESGSGLSIVERRVVHYPDAAHGKEVPTKTRQGCRAIGIKSVIFAPLLWEGRALGAIFVGRDHVSSFSEKEIALLKTFADQAVIAIQNARLFREIQEKSQQLEVANRHKSEFLANMSHELRTPLNAIIGFTRIVMRRSQAELEPKQYENLEKILASGQHLLALINAILDLSKVEAGRIEVNPDDVSLAPVLEQCLRTVEPLVKAEAVTLVREFAGAPPQMYVDEQKLRQIVINLLSNAAKFTARGSIRLQAQAANGSVAITVADTGIGIPADKLELVFEEFAQLDASSTRVHAGTGLGLAIARRLARLMGGDIRAESVLGAGSTFTLTLPTRYASREA
jgi:PAS domain S-box-containing protein